MIFDAWRTNGGPTQHPAMPTAVTSDVLEIGFVFAFCILAFSFVLIIPGYKGVSRLYMLLRVVISLFIGASIFLGVLGQDWESAEIETKTAYKAFTKTEIHAKVGMKIGLGSVNVTLKGTPIYQTVGHSDSVNFTERIDYNERFHWAWRQGRIGFGPYAGRINQEFRQAQYRGVPLPIQWVAEYFTLDGELIRWGRSYRTAGWFANQVLWTAVPVWLIANILSCVVLFYAGCMFMVTSVFMFVSLIIWSTIKWGTQPLSIPFEDGVLYTHYGSSFWLVVSGGIVSFLYGAIIAMMDTFTPQLIADFFGIDVLKDSEEFFHKHEDDDIADVESPGFELGTTGGVQKRFAKHNRTAKSRVWASRRRKSRSTLKRDLKLESDVSGRNVYVYTNPDAHESLNPGEISGSRRSPGFSNIWDRAASLNVESSDGIQPVEIKNSTSPKAIAPGKDTPSYSGENIYENTAYVGAVQLKECTNTDGIGTFSVHNSNASFDQTAM
uniref:dual oxidase maturation factor 1-like n=1 Tax=Ciona intestinalis TaxID=7719 RepID=UPI000180BAF1|nr:dual oxidase maturation factor 1-like [Ciona intestinalis]|eukprot:XP_002128668.1 dual oxidase maturation factor 1-like [Ciona intestinalis]